MTLLAPAQYLRHLQPSYIREILAAATRPDVISLAGGLPAEECFPMNIMADSLACLPSRPDLFQYGATQGYTPLVEYVESSFTSDPKHKALVCNGSQQALDLVARAFINPGDKVVMEAPGYLGAIQVFSLAQAQLLPLVQQADGPDIFALQALFENNQIKLFYAVPDFHNPTGVTWSLEKRQQVAKLCKQFDVTLLEDAPYRDIRFAGSPQPMVSSFCVDQAIALRSFSKSICPGMRLGMAMASQEVINTMIKVKQAADLHTSVPLQAVLLETLLHDKYPDHLSAVGKEYGQRYQSLCNAIQQQLGTNVNYVAVEGGMFIWLNIPGGHAMTIAQRAIEQKLAVVPGDVFYTDKSDQDCYLRLNFSHTPVDQFPEAIRRLSASL